MLGTGGSSFGDCRVRGCPGSWRPTLGTSPTGWARGARVVVVDLQEEAGQALCRELGDAVVFLGGDVAELRKSGNASVITFGSGAGLDGRPNQASYAAAKEAIRGLSRVVANEWAPLDIRVNVVCPMALTAGVSAGPARAVRPVRGQGAAGPLRRPRPGRRAHRRLPGQ